MHFFWVALFSSALLARGSPLPPAPLERRAAVQLHILTEGTEACTADEVTVVKRAIIEARELAEIAITTLKVKDMQRANGFFQIFGGKEFANPADVSQRYKFVTALPIPDEVTSESLKVFAKNPDDHVTFTCIPPTDRKVETAYANTANAGRPTAESKGAEVPTNNLIRFAPLAIKNSESFKTAVARVRTTGDLVNDIFLSEGEVMLPLPAFIIIHEVQHSFPLVGNNELAHFVDQTGPNGKHADGLYQIQELASGLRARNPQNYAWFALLAAVQPKLFAANVPIEPEPPKAAAKPKKAPKKAATSKKASKKVKARAAKSAAAPAKKPATVKAPVKAPVKIPTKAVTKPLAKPVVKAPVNLPTTNKVKAKTPIKVTPPVSKPPVMPKVPAKVPVKVTGPVAKPPVKATKPAAIPPLSPPTSNKAPTKPAAKTPAKSVAKPATGAPATVNAKTAGCPVSDLKFLDFD
ncbi:hypothetical protein B0H15DRAFT_244658 [Mycena belliarum]|uniref:Uncharacterized protein n=1 Tax=Mycena belliarum TaxID=1033014 RepID=A0AAD6U4Q4_9AGAR|nr:hypothetical protein B0H15DRAFT_244658 [Mycena belliae]